MKCYHCTNDICPGEPVSYHTQLVFLALYGLRLFYSHQLNMTMVEINDKYIFAAILPYLSTSPDLQNLQDLVKRSIVNVSMATFCQYIFSFLHIVSILFIDYIT